MVTRPWGDSAYAVGLKNSGGGGGGGGKKGGLLGLGRRVLGGGGRGLLGWKEEDGGGGGGGVEWAKDEWIEFRRRDGRRLGLWNRVVRVFGKVGRTEVC